MKSRLNINGQDVEVERVHVTSSTEPANTYLLEDGTTLEIKLVVTEVLKATEARSPDGLPLYVTKSQNLLTVTPGEGT